jgi:hypothetical protein
LKELYQIFFCFYLLRLGVLSQPYCGIYLMQSLLFFLQQLILIDQRQIILSPQNEHHLVFVPSVGLVPKFVRGIPLIMERLY